jgi:hypothetical protein
MCSRALERIEGGALVITGVGGTTWISSGDENGSESGIIMSERVGGRKKKINQWSLCTKPT